MSEAPAIGFSISVQIGEKQSIVAQTHIDQSASLSEINATIDKVQAALERQKLKVDLADWRKKLAYDEKKLRQIKEDPQLKRIPVVMMTSSREERDLVRSYDLGVNAYVVKPVKFLDFVESVKQLGVFWALINEPPPVSGH